MNPEKSALIRFLRAPLELRSYANLLFLALAFPMGLAYFIFLSTGLTVGVGLTLIWVGLPILALVFAASWGLMALERQLAIHLLGAEVPPMAPTAPASAAPRGVWQTVKDFFANPVTWKGMGYLLIKLPLGMLTFTVTIFLVSLSASFLIAPFAHFLGSSAGVLEWDGMVWNVDTPGAAVFCIGIGLVTAFLSVHILNGLAWIWRQLASALLGSERYVTAA
jgi:hypothetical protein